MEKNTLERIKKAIELAFVDTLSLHSSEFRWENKTTFSGTDESCDFKGVILDIDENNFWESKLEYNADFIDYEKDKETIKLSDLFKRVVFDI